MSYIYNSVQNYEFVDPHYNHQSMFPTMWSDPMLNQFIPSIQPPTQLVQQSQDTTEVLNDQALVLKDQALTFSQDGTTVYTESKTIPLEYYIYQLRDWHRFHYKNPNTATCWFWIKGFTEQAFPAHRIYLATQSLYFRSIFETYNNINITQALELDLPHPDVFPGIYNFLYDGNEDAWLEGWFKDGEQIKRSWELVKFLDLVGVPDKVSLRARLELEAVKLR
ncbi:hypothetical protein BC937DRAFT_95353 [Endogone sp. FLAS-F59071]|nr:hypothetical protein BC937DRAFT_95353 [Endogone sp. FLAS-F59071]|eukprot:RUS13426.1 hypothetical protein BC937DRAFT_95353 [Endogone sp. FLAS-F59071]